MNTKHHIPSSAPVALIESLPRKATQPANMRAYREGYEYYMALLPVMTEPDPALREVTHAVMSNLAHKLTTERPPWLGRDLPKFERSILAVEERTGHEGAEILVAHWPKGFTSPVHGHAGGYLYEQVLTGRILVNLYRHVGNRLVRPLRSIVQEFPDILASDFVADVPGQPRIGYVHSFTALTPVDTIHFLPEHTRDSRDNSVTIEYYNGANEEFERLDIAHAVHATKPGDVALVRSNRVSEIGDHWVIITGGLVKKPHGWRPEDAHFEAPNMSPVLDKHEADSYGMVFLKLKDPTAFYEFHGIKVAGGREVTFQSV